MSSAVGIAFLQVGEDVKAFTHMAAGGLFALQAIPFIAASPGKATYLLGGGIIGSLLPDVDHPSSSFGRRVLPVSLLLSATFGHRGITHSLFAVVAITLLVWFGLAKTGGYPDFVNPLAIGLSLGYLSHLFADYFTNSGVPLLWPNKRKFAFFVTVKTGSISEYVLAIVLYVALYRNMVEVVK